MPVWKLKDTQENANQLMTYFLDREQLNVPDLPTFVNRLLACYNATSITHGGVTYTFTATLFYEALYSFVEHLHAQCNTNPEYRKVLGHFVLLYLTSLSAQQVKQVGDMLVVGIPQTPYTFRLHKTMMADLTKIAQENKLIAVRTAIPG